ncbi:hypothetical protein P7C73_g3267, partial [Tremellales sp. Uapishka_1]
MQRTSQNSASSSASTALRRALRPSSSSEHLGEDYDDLSDPRPWETRGAAHTYGSLREKTSAPDLNLPLYSEDLSMERRRKYGEKEDADVVKEEKELLDDQGKWAKGHGAGPGVGGRRGLEPRKRVGGWKRTLVEHEEWVWTIIYTLLSMITRYWRIGAANYVVWDEAHFGKFGSHYINRDFYFDVHPPLGKMLVGLAGLLSGYNGGFDFKSGAEYPADLPHTSMRIILATFGVALVPIAWWTAGEMGWSRYTRHWVTICVLCGMPFGYCQQAGQTDPSRYRMAVYLAVHPSRFHVAVLHVHDRAGIDQVPQSTPRWVGMFVTALVGLYTIEDLWEKFGDLSMPIRTYIKHWLARGFALIILPFIVYASCFKIHFMILNRSGPGDAQMSSLFQAHLKGNDFGESPLEVAFGSKLTLKNYGYGGGLLHSHVQTYPVGSNQQQVTCYHYKDENNNFIITPVWEADPVDPDGPIRYLQDGDSLRLLHASTGRNIHSHPVAAPVTKLNYEVSGYGNETVGDSNDVWIVEVVDDTHRTKKDAADGRIHSLTTRMRFKHKDLNCYLRAANAVLPQWGFKQVEVSCDKENNPKDVHTYWNVESHWNERLPAGNVKLYRSPFWRDFSHLNVAMWTSNNALVPDPDKEDILASQPFDWPFLRLGLRMCGWGDQQIKFYLLGTPIIWWWSSISLVCGLGAVAWYMLRAQRQYKDWSPGEWDQFLYVTKIAFGGWAFQYMPFLIMGRVTYLHHYLPTLWFAVIMAGHVLELFIFGSTKRTRRNKNIWFLIWTGSVMFCFWWFKDLALGIHGSVDNQWGWMLRPTWNVSPADVYWDAG